MKGAAQAALRERAVRLVLAGETYQSVGEAMGVNVRTVGKWVARFEVSGWSGLGERRRGRRPGEQMSLSEDQQAQLVALIKGRNPDQLQIEGVLWSRGAVKALILRRFGVSLSRQTVGVYLRRWGWTAKKPQKRWAEQDPERVQAWISEEYPKIKARAQRERALIMFCDEMGVRSGQTAGTTYAPRGERAIVELPGKRFGVNVISAIAINGELLFEVFEGNCDEIRFLDFCDKLLEQLPKRKLFLILDNARFHKSSAVEAWEEDHPRLELFFIPPYAPELNPVELLNQDVHSHVARRRPADLVNLIALTVAYLGTRTREIVRNYFKGEYVSYTLCAAGLITSLGPICPSP